MLFFISYDLEKIIRDLQEKLIKPDVLQDCNNVTKLLKVDHATDSNHKRLESIDIGFVKFFQNVKPITYDLQMTYSCFDSIKVLSLIVRFWLKLNYKYFSNFLVLKPLL